MIGYEKIKPTAHELMELHTEAMFTHDQRMRIHEVNEPWPGSPPAPRFFLGRTIEGTTVCRFRHDVPDPLVERLNILCAGEPIVRDFHTKPKQFETYMELLQGEKFTMGPCFLIPDKIAPLVQVVSITRDNISEINLDGFEWLASEIDYVQPCMAIVCEGRAVSICQSVRISPRAHEAGLETLEAFRGRGYAANVVAGWAMAMRKMGRIPLYSTSSDNVSSQRVAKKCALEFYGVNFSII
ncbi:kasugamycin N-acetyltransferase AAC(2')-IIb [Paenibacillus sp. NPDC056579]|uniref:kasugamycin N-acetyltransferase AAC(2')-IIb n=1 Tax=Paenibacillus sp. NPDC056579 TaxID=3345871 RepID=UPI0036BBE3C2